MFLRPRLNASSHPVRRSRFPLLPWLFVIAVVASGLYPARHYVRQWQRDRPPSVEFAEVWSKADLAARHRAAVLHTIDGDTFEARVAVISGTETVTRVRLRGIDAPEMKAACPRELQLAEAATEALRTLLRDGEIAIYNIGPDKYSGRVVADVATARTPDVSAALLAAGRVRRYDGGRRQGWC
jgi:endonuclease YncB( thermonuclease family)